MLKLEVEAETLPELIAKVLHALGLQHIVQVGIAVRQSDEIEDALNNREPQH